MIEKRRTTGPRIGPRLTSPQPAPPPTVVQLGSDRVLAGAREVDIAQLRPDPDQPRTFMQPDRLAELAESILQHGLLQPLVVRQEGLAPDGDMRYVVIAGGRRYAALRLLLDRPLDGATRARITRVRVIVNESEANERRVLQLIENLQREDLSPVEEARSFKEIMHVEALTTTALASRVHRSQGYIDERLRLLRYEEIEAAVEAGWLTKSAGAAIASLSSADARQSWLARASDGERIRPRDIYASKANVSKRASVTPSTTPANLPNFGKATRETRESEGPLPNFDETRALPSSTPDLPKFGKEESSPALATVADLPKFGKPGRDMESAGVLPNFGNGAMEGEHGTSLPAREVPRPSANAGLPNFGNRAYPDPVSVGKDDVLATLTALRVQLEVLPLPDTSDERIRLTAELGATLAVVERLLMAIRDDATEDR